MRFAFLQHLVQRRRFRVHFGRRLANSARGPDSLCLITCHLCAEAGLVQLTNADATVIQAVREVDVSGADGEKARFR